MGVLFKAEDTRLGRLVALKFLTEQLATDRAALERFQREARAASALNHPHICTIYDIGETNGRSFLVMELLEGQTIRQRVEKGTVPVPDLIELSIQISDALETAHAKGIVHRDIKPANLFITERGQAKVLDFGLAKLDAPRSPGSAITAAEDTQLTGSGSVMGTIAYMSPEQARGEAVDGRSDLFSFGCVMFEMATARPAFGGDTTALVFDAILNRTPPAIHHLNPDMPARLWEIVRKTLEKKTAARYPNFATLKADLKHLQTDLAGGGAGAAIAETVQPEGESIAVLPFRDMSPQHDQEYFCDGMAEELINALTNIEGLHVTPRLTAFQFKEKNQDVTAIGTELGVATLLEGSVRKAGNRLRITTQLIDVASGRNLWSERYDRDMEDVFAIQDEIARTIVDRLKIQIRGRAAGRPLVKRYTADLDAYNLYLKGRYYWNKRYHGGLQKGMIFFQQAIERDPNYALAYTGLSDSLGVLATYSYVKPRDGFAKAKAVAERALQIDDTLSEAQTSMGFAHLFYDWNWIEAGKSFQRAIELNPAYPVAHYYEALRLVSAGHFDEAALASTRALDLDPVSAIAGTFKGWVSLQARRYDRAIEELRGTFELDPSAYIAVSLLGLTYACAGRIPEAIASINTALELTGRAKIMLDGAGLIYASAGMKDEARAVIEELKKGEGYPSAFHTAAIYAVMNEFDAAFEWLDRAYADRDGFMIYLNVFPFLDNIRSDPRFAAFQKHVGFRQ